MEVNVADAYDAAKAKDESRDQRVARALAMLEAFEDRWAREYAKPRPNKQTVWVLKCLEDAAEQRLAAGVPACGHLKGDCTQCHQCLLEAGATTCLVCDLPSGVIASDAARVQRLRDALEGECDGLSIDEHHTRAVLEYVDGVTPTDNPR